MSSTRLFDSHEKPRQQPLAAGHFKIGNDQGARTIFCSLGPVKNLNRLADGQQIRFAPAGLTLIYGDNGSGKSGYCRAAKKLCRSLSSEELLGDVFGDGPASVVEVLVRFQEDGAAEPTAVTWVDGTPPPEQVARISVFDSANARLYIDRENRIGFLPVEVALLEAHGSLRKSLDTKFKSEIATLDRGLRTPLPAGYSPGSQVSSHLSRLDSKWQGTLPTKEEVEKLAVVTAVEEQELEALNAALASDPATLAARCRRVAAVLKGFVKHVTLSTINCPRMPSSST